MMESVRAYYSSLKDTSSLRTQTCCSSAPSSSLLREALTAVPTAVLLKYYGCGNCVPSYLSGLTLLDLGCGTGRDVFIAAKLAGPKGRVIGVDMLPSQLQVGRDSLKEFSERVGFEPNIRFIEGYVEDLKDIDSESVDVVTSNCVVNLSPNKEAVLREAFRVLKVGGEMLFSDIYGDRRLPEAVRKHEVLWGECIGGALYLNDFIALAKKVGFLDVREVERSDVDVDDTELAALVGNARFFSITFRLFKLPNMEPNCEDYGQFAKYLGTIPGEPHKFKLDSGHVFETGRNVAVCGNTASMLSETHLRSHFTVTGDRSTHFGQFASCGTPQQSGSSKESKKSEKSCC